MANANVKFSVEAAQFKADMAKVNSELKEQKAEIKNVEKSFNSSTTAEEKFTAKGKLLNQMAETAGQKVQMLNAKFENEKQKLADCAKALEEAKAKHGENSKEVQAAELAYTKQSTAVHNAKTALVQAKGEVDAITREYKQMEDAANGAGEEQKDLSKDTKDVGNAANESKDKVNIFGEVLKANLAGKLIEKGISSIINGVKKIGTACVNAAKGAAKIFGESVQWADDIATLSVQTGISTKTLQEYQYMTGLVDVSVETLTGSHTKLLQAMNKAQGGSKGSIASFEKLGVTWQNTDGSLRSTTDVFNDAINSLGKMTNESERDALAMEIFGKKAQDLNPLIEAGSDAIKGLADEAHRVGAVLDDDAIGQLTRTQDALDRIKATWAGTKRQLSAKFAPAIATALEKSIPLLNSFSNVLMSIGQKVMPVFEKFINFAVKALDRLDKAFKKNGIQGLATEIGKLLSDTIRKISQKAPQVINSVLGVLKNVGSELLKALPGIFNQIVSKLPSLLSKIGTFLKQALPSLADTVGQMLGSLFANTPAILDAGFKLIGSIIDGVVMAIPNLISGIVYGFNTSMDESKKIVNEDVEAIKQKIEEIPSATDRIKDTLADIDAQYRDAEHWLDIFDSLSTKTSLTTEEQAKLNDAIKHLQELYPELGEIVQDETGKWNLNTQEIRDNIEALKERAYADAWGENAKEILKEIIGLEIDKAKLEEDYKVKDTEYNDSLRIYKGWKNVEQAIRDLNLEYLNGKITEEEYIAKANEINDLSLDLGVGFSSGIKTLEDAGLLWTLINGHADSYKKKTDILREQRKQLNDGITEANQKIKSLNSDVEYSYDQQDKWLKLSELNVKSLKTATESAAKGITEALDEIPKKFGDIADDAQSSGEKIGGNLMDGVDVGIDDHTQGVVNRARSAITQAINAMKLAGDINSPSRLTRDLIGKNLGLGIGVGFEDALHSQEMKRRLDMSDLFTRMKISGDDLTATITHSLDGSTAGVYQGSKTYNNMFQITINAAPGMDANELYETFKERLNEDLASAEAVFA